MKTAEAQAILQRSIERYRLACHQRVAPFVARHFCLRGTLRLHRHAIGADLLRAPANAILLVIFLLRRLLALGCRCVGRVTWARRLEARPIFFETAVSRALAQHLARELLQLPDTAAAPGAGRRAGAAGRPDGLTLAILADPALQEDTADAPAPAQPAQHLRPLLDDYTGARAAAGDLLTNALLAGAGAAAFKQLTPGALSLAPLIAATLAQQAAIAAFPLGAWLGATWYAAFPPEPSPLLLAGTIVALILLGSVAAAFAGVIVDPLLRLTGVHHRRLHRLIDALAARLNGEDAKLNVPDHYLARVFDLVDILRAVRRSTS
jgi:hypothetical protein